MITKTMNLVSQGPMHRESQEPIIITLFITTVFDSLRMLPTDKFLGGQNVDYKGIVIKGEYI